MQSTECELRRKLIAQIEHLRDSRVLTYVTGDRLNLVAQITDEAVPPMYDLVRTIGKTKKIDLFLYSRGGSIDVPWKIVCMLREYCEKLRVLVPFRAHSAATLIALGCDEIVMGPKAELGPVDPALPTQLVTPAGITQEDIRVEDIMAYVGFLREKVGLGDQAALSQGVSHLAGRLNPWMIGNIYRTHTHIRQVAQRLLTVHREPLRDPVVADIVEALCEKTYQHQHAISRKEATTLRLPVTEAPDQLESAMWDLYERYAGVLRLNEPFLPDSVLSEDQDHADATVLVGFIETREESRIFEAQIGIERRRAAAGQYSVGHSFNITLSDATLPTPDQQQLIQSILQQIQQQLVDFVGPAIAEQIRLQSPVVGVETRPISSRWVSRSGEVSMPA